MSHPPDDWRKLFGAIDVSAAGVQAAPLSQPPHQAVSASPVATPNLVQRAVTFGTSMAKFAAGGFQTTPQTLADQRLATCQSCEQLQNKICVACGCVIPLKVKMPHETCPLGRWPS